MTCAICTQDHAADAPCGNIVRQRSGATIPFGSPETPAPPSATPEGDDPLIGRSFGSFRIVRKVGQGGMGTVYLGENTVIGSKVAVKVLHEYLASNADLVRRFYAEARAVNLIGHENIVNIIDLAKAEPNTYYLIMEYLEGQPLTAMTRKPVPATTAIPILMQVCDALDAAHQRGVVHRDLKPENIVLVNRGRNPNFVKILDFGIAKLFATESSESTSVGTIVGTPEYMAPEQASGEPIDGRTDTYALGIISYLLAVGHLPFSSGGLTGLLLAHREKVPPAPHVALPTVPRAWSDIIMKAIAKAPADRYASAAAMRVALETALEAIKLSSAKVIQPTPLPVEPVPTPEPAHSRHLASFEATVTTASGEALGKLRCTDISRGGAFLCSDQTFPPLFSRVRFSLATPGGVVLALTGEVVRHVTQEQARAWQMAPGFGVQFVELDQSNRDNLARLVVGLPAVQPDQPLRTYLDDPAAEQAIDHYRKRINGDHYVMLGLAADAELSEIRARAREAIRELESLGQRPLSERQKPQVAHALEKVRAAFDVVGNLARRAEYDANRANFRGVARCISAGLTVTELDELRRRFLGGHPNAESNALVHVATASAYENQQDLGGAVAAYEAALGLDPLNLRYHQRYWSLRRKMQPPTGSSPP